MAPGNSHGGPDPHRDGELYRRYPARSARSDEEIGAEIRDRLVRDERVDADQVTVTVESGTVTLYGEVATLWEKRVAGEDALDVEGVVDVGNLLRVADPAAAGR